MMEPERLLLVFERSPEESQLRGVDEALRALGQNDVDVEAATPQGGAVGLFGRLMRFWFPYVWSQGITGVTPSAGVGPAAEVAEFNVTLAPTPGPVFGAILRAWLKAQPGRKVRVKFVDIEIEAQTPEQVASLMSELEALRQNRKLAG
jgi:hypothetical protein